MSLEPVDELVHIVECVGRHRIKRPTRTEWQVSCRSAAMTTNAACATEGAPSDVRAAAAWVGLTGGGKG